LSSSLELKQVSKSTKMDVDEVTTGSSSLEAGVIETLPIPPGAEPSNFDVQSYISRYAGPTRLVRLQLIAEECPSLQGEVIALIVRELTQSSNVNSEVFRRNEGRLGQLLPADWADGVEASALATSDRLEAQVSGAKSSMSKEAIRSAYIELAEFLRRRGDSSSALKSLLRSRDYCSTERELAECCLKVVTCGFEVNNLVQVTNHLAKAEAPASQGLLDPSQQASLVAAQGLVFLKKRQYRSAARKFFEVDASLGDSLNEVLSCEDVATYGCLCALAELDRDEVKRRLVDPPSTSSGSSFRHFLDLVPQMRDVAEDVCECRYGKALATLERGLSAEFLMDVHLRDHAAALVTSIRNKCICRYFLPFVSVSLAAMATALGTPLPTLEAQVNRVFSHSFLSFSRTLALTYSFCLFLSPSSFFSFVTSAFETYYRCAFYHCYRRCCSCLFQWLPPFW